LVIVQGIVVSCEISIISIQHFMWKQKVPGRTYGASFASKLVVTVSKVLRLTDTNRNEISQINFGADPHHQMLFKSVGLFRRCNNLPITRSFHIFCAKNASHELFSHGFW
jgi:hypothetical protein